VPRGHLEGRHRLSLEVDPDPQRRLAVLETPALLVVGALITLRAEWPILFHPFTFQPDALTHEWWMRQWRDSALFHDPLTAAIKATGFVPVGLQALDRSAAAMVDPVTFAAWLPLVLAPACGWLVFAIVRVHTAWRPAAWFGALLYLAPVNIERFSGGHARAFGEPAALLTLWLLVSGRRRLAVAVPPVAALLYPPGAGVAIGVMGFTAVLRRRPDLRGLALTAGSSVATGVVLLASGLHSAISLASARAGGEFGADGQLHFFARDLITYLSQNLSGFNLQGSGSIVVVAALVVLPARHVRREVWALIASCLVLFVLAHALLFRLYMPNRYVQPLVPAFAIVAAVGWGDMFARIRPRLRPTAAVVVPLVVVAAGLMLFPLGPRHAAAVVAAFARSHVVELVTAVAIGAAAAAAVRSRPAAAASVLAAAAVIGATYAAGGEVSPATVCGDRALLRELGTLPPSAVIAGDPIAMNCVPMVARRPVVISVKLNQPVEAQYAPIVRARMSAMIAAEFSSSPTPLSRLVNAFGARYLVVRTAPHLRAVPAAWHGNQPYTEQIATLLRGSDGPYVQRLGSRCLVWSAGADRLYALRCLLR
jgi:hypothetical protein